MAQVRRIKQAIAVISVLIIGVVAWHLLHAGPPVRTPPLAKLSTGERMSVIEADDLDHYDGDPEPFRELAIAGAVGESAADLVRRENAALLKHGWSDSETFTVDWNDSDRYVSAAVGTKDSSTLLDERGKNINIVLLASSTYAHFLTTCYGQPIYFNPRKVRVAIAQGRPVLYVQLGYGLHG